MARRPAQTIRSPMPGREQLAKLLSAQEGFVAVMVALLIAALIGVAGLATEAGMWYALKRQNQTATDAAALTAAFEYAGRIVTGVTTNSPSAAATSTASNNQFNTATPNTVTVNTPVCTVGNVNCTVQVVLTDQLNTLFAHEYLPSTTTIATSATAEYQTLVNSNGTPVGQTCLLGLGTDNTNPPTGNVFQVNGHGSFNMPNCIIGSLSTDTDSMVINGGSGTWNLAALATAGGITVHGNPSLPQTFTQQPIAEPLCIGNKTAAHRLVPFRCLHSRSELQLEYAVDAESRLLLRSDIHRCCQCQAQPWDVLH